MWTRSLEKGRSVCRSRDRGLSVRIEPQERSSCWRASVLIGSLASARLGLWPLLRRAFSPTSQLPVIIKLTGNRAATRQIISGKVTEERMREHESSTRAKVNPTSDWVSTPIDWFVPTHRAKVSIQRTDVRRLHWMLSLGLAELGF